MHLRFWNLILDLNIFIIVATVPTGLQTCAKVLQMHISGDGGTPWWQHKSNVTFKSTSVDAFKILESDFGFNIFIIVATVPTGLQTCAKVLQCPFQGVAGHLGCNPKVMSLLN